MVGFLFADVHRHTGPESGIKTDNGNGHGIIHSITSSSASVDHGPKTNSPDRSIFRGACQLTPPPSTRLQMESLAYLGSVCPVSMSIRSTESNKPSLPVHLLNSCPGYLSILYRVLRSPTPYTTEYSSTPGYLLVLQSTSYPVVLRTLRRLSSPCPEPSTTPYTILSAANHLSSCAIVQPA